MKRDWDKLKRQDRSTKDLSESQFRALKLKRLLEWREKHPFAKNWKFPENL